MALAACLRMVSRNPRQLAGKIPTWLVLYDAPGTARSDGECVVYGDLLRNR